ncbi:hypothetical protein AB0A73_21650 [Glycomyces sp. NPDC047369]
MATSEEAVATAAWSLLAAANGLTDELPGTQPGNLQSVMRDRIDGEDGRVLRQAGHGDLLDAIVAAHEDPVGRAGDVPGLMRALADLAGVDYEQVMQAVLESDPSSGVVSGAAAVTAKLSRRIEAHRHKYDLGDLASGLDDAVAELFGQLCGAVSTDCAGCTDLLLGMLCADPAALDAFIAMMRRAWRGAEPRLARLMRLTRPGADPELLDLLATFDRVLVNDGPGERLAFLDAAPPTARVHLASIAASLIILAPAAD